MLGKFMSDCELAWMKGGIGTYLFKHTWRGMDRESEQREKTLHPTLRSPLPSSPGFCKGPKSARRKLSLTPTWDRLLVP